MILAAPKKENRTWKRFPRCGLAHKYLGDYSGNPPMGGTGASRSRDEPPFLGLSRVSSITINVPLSPSPSFIKGLMWEAPTGF